MQINPMNKVQTFWYTGTFNTRINKGVLLEIQWSEAHAVLPCSCSMLEGDRVASVCVLRLCMVCYMCTGKGGGQMDVRK